MKKLNICLVTLKLPPDSQDGEANVFRAYYNYLIKQGHNVKVLTGKWNIKLKDPNIKQINLISKRFFWIPQFNFQVARYLMEHKDEFDIIHGNGPKGTFPIILSNQRRFISTIHDLGRFETKFSTIPIEKILIKYIVQRATYITTVSEFVKKEFKHFIPKINPNKIHNFYNGIDEKFKPYPLEAQQLKAKLNIKGPVILYIGRIATYKGVVDIISAYKLARNKVNNLNLIIGGLPDYSMKKTYQEWKQLYKDINFVGFIPENEIPYYYTMGDIFITYSYASEGFGLTPIEAIACGTPVICSSLKVFYEVLQDKAIFVPPRSPKLLADEILRLLKNKPFRDNLIKEGQEFIKRYRWDVIGKKLEKLYYRFSSV